MINKPLRPFFSFYGSKWMAARRYQAPRPGDVIIEPFCGSAGYSLWHQPAATIMCDLDPAICAVWRYLIAASPEEILRLPDLESTEQLIDDLPVCQEARYLIGFWANRGSAAPARRPSPWQIKYQDSANNQLVWSQRARERIAFNLHRIRHLAIVEGDYRDLPILSNATYFVDPPYAVKGSRYVHSHVNYPELAEWCRSLPRAIVCEQEGATWLPFEPLGSFKSTRGTSQEVVWTTPTMV